MKLNQISNNPGAHKHKHKVGRGSSSGLGKTSGRGVKGAKARTGTKVYGFEGGQMPLHMRMPKRGFNNPFALKFAEVNLWRLEQAIAAGKLDSKKAIDGAALVAAGVIRRELDGVRLLAKGELKSKIDITVYGASAAAKAAVEKAGGSVTLTAPVESDEPKGKLQKKVKA